MRPFRSILVAFVSAALPLLVGVHDGFGGEYQYHPVVGPQETEIGEGTATIRVPDNVVLLGREDSRQAALEMKERVDEQRIAMLIPRSEKQGWVAFVRYLETGYIRDADAGSIDPDGLLEEIRRGTEEANRERKKNGNPLQISVVGWHAKPLYDRDRNRLSWALVGQDDATKEKIVNYTSITLGRRGILSCTIADSYEKMVSAEATLGTISASLNFRPGKDYGSWVQGDRVSDLTMTTLITGGAAGAAYAVAKTGLLAKAGKFLIAAFLALKKALVVIVLAVVAFFKKLRDRISGKRAPSATGQPS